MINLVGPAKVFSACFSVNFSQTNGRNFGRGGGSRGEDMNEEVFTKNKGIVCIQFK